MEDGQTIEYEGHDAARSGKETNPKDVDQPRFLPTGKPSQNGLFADTVDAHRVGRKQPDVVRVYEKVFPGVWSEKGFFLLTDYKFVSDGKRNVFKFYLKAMEGSPGGAESKYAPSSSRLIPSDVKKEVWKRDKGRCVLCGARENLHFDHDIPWSKGGASMSTENVRILCARHNIEKRDKIE